ncbi:hypothetical protein U6N61_12170, partial [Cutibacterium acnes]
PGTSAIGRVCTPASLDPGFRRDAPWPRRGPSVGTMKALTPGDRHLGRQVSPLISCTLPDVPPPTTWQVPSSL